MNEKLKNDFGERKREEIKSKTFSCSQRDLAERKGGFGREEEMEEKYKKQLHMHPWEFLN